MLSIVEKRGEGMGAVIENAQRYVQPERNASHIQMDPKRLAVSGSVCHQLWFGRGVVLTLSH